MTAPELTIKVNELSQKFDRLQEFANAVQLQLANLSPEAKAAGLTAADAEKSVIKLETALAKIETNIALMVQQIGAMDHLKQQPSAVSDLKADVQKNVALLNREIEELKEWQAEKKQEEKDSKSRTWMLVPPIIAAILSSSLTVLLTLLISKLNK
jgi:predicted  nucleic acid-binding Zn-ribbon protein